MRLCLSAVLLFVFALACSSDDSAKIADLESEVNALRMKLADTEAEIEIQAQKLSAMEAETELQSMGLESLAVRSVRVEDVLLEAVASAEYDLQKVFMPRVVNLETVVGMLLTGELSLGVALEQRDAQERATWVSVGLDPAALDALKESKEDLAEIDKEIEKLTGVSAEERKREIDYWLNK